MKRNKNIYDVFISYAAKDLAIAEEIARACNLAGLAAFTGIESHVGSNWSNAVWEALAETRALLLILSQTIPNPTMAIEIGAARAWNKPIYAVVTDPSTTHHSFMDIANIRLFTKGRIDDVIRAIQASIEQLTDEDQFMLASIYAELGVPSDGLARDPLSLQLLKDKFELATGKCISGERLLSELIRLRKARKLQRFGRSRAGRLKANSEPA